MPQRELLINAFGGFRETLVYDDDRPNDLLIKTYSDPEPFKAHASVLADRVPGKDFRHVAVIPPEVLDKAAREGWLNDRPAWKKWANDGANVHLRTWKGRI